jgi:acyl carrier protein
MDYKNNRYYKTLVAVIVEALGLSGGSQVLPESTLRSLGGDSLDEVEILIEIEEIFDVDLSDEEVEKIKTVAEMANYLSDLLGEFNPIWEKEIAPLVTTPDYPHASRHPRYFIMQVPRISTGHITKEDGVRLLEERDSEVLAKENYRNGSSWHAVFLEDYDPEEWARYSQEFRNILSFFSGRGYLYLAFDANGDELPWFPTFDW